MGDALTRSSRLKISARSRLGLLAGSAAGGLAAAGAAYAQPPDVPQAQVTTVPRTANAAQPAAPEHRLNPTGREVVLTIPVKDGNAYLGDIGLVISPTDRLTFSSQRMLDLLSNILDPKVLDTLKGSFAGKTIVGPEAFASSGISVTYDPQTLELDLIVPAHMRGARPIQVSALNQARFGSFVRPATVSAYLNIRGAGSYIWSGPQQGWENPSFDLQGAARIGLFELESEAIWTPSVHHDSPDIFQRLDTRLVYDDSQNVIRWTLGDLQTIGRSFQSAPQIAGISAFRSYSVLEPQTIARPVGSNSFTLDRPSTVEVYLNGQLVKRLLLNPGRFNLSDFPFAQGANDVRLAIMDDTGRTQVLRFNLFLDQSQLAKGLSEFGFYAGVAAPVGRDGPVYSHDLQFSGWYRRGISDQLTLGVNLQADNRVQMGGVEAVVGTSFGVVSGQLAASQMKGFGSGYAATITYQRLLTRSSGLSDSINLAFQTISKSFAPLDTLVPNNPYQWTLTAGYSHSLTRDLFGGFDLNFSKGRDGQHDDQTYRGTVGWQVTRDAAFTATLLYEDNSSQRDVGAIVSLTWRLGQFSSVRADYDSRDNDARVTYQTLHGYGVGSYNLSADIERNDFGSNLNASANYIANRVELGLTQANAFNGAFSSTTSNVTSLRFGTSLAFADGAVAIGRPIYDAFAIVTPYRTLQGAPVIVDPSAYGHQASTGALGAAIEPNLASYNERVVTVDAPTAPIGVDLGTGSFRLFPPYHGGYRLQVGSEYYVTVIGRMLTEEGAPLSLVSGQATELAHPGGAPVTVFTNREGRFGLSGLKPGRWRIEMLTDPTTVYIIDVPAKAPGLMREGDIKPNGQ